MPHMHYDEADVAGVQTFAQKTNHTFNEDQTIFLARQLDYVKARTYDRRMPPMNGLALVPQESDAPEWAEAIIYRSYDMVGMAKIISNYADDLPRADVTGSERMVPVRTIGDSYGYNVNELNISAATGTDLPGRKAAAARLAIEVKINQIAMVGDVPHGLYGILNHPNIGATTGLVGDWSGAATGADIVSDVDALYTAVRTQSRGVHTPNRLALPTAALSAMQNKYVENSLGRTAFDVIRNKYPGLQLMDLPELSDVDGDSMAIIGEFDANNASLETVMPFNQLPAQARNLELVVPCLARTGGVSVHYPLAFTRAIGL